VVKFCLQALLNKQRKGFLKILEDKIVKSIQLYTIAGEME
jgi:hypothetical protein